MGNISMQTRILVSLKNPIVYKILTTVFALAGVLYAWAVIDSFLSLQASLDSPETVEIMGSEWPVSAIDALIFRGLAMIFGPYAAGILAVQLGLFVQFRPKRHWLAVGVVVCLICCSAIWNWIAHQQ